MLGLTLTSCSNDAKIIQADADGSTAGMDLLQEGWQPVDVNTTGLQNDMYGADPRLHNGSYVFVGYRKEDTSPSSVELVLAGLAGDHEHYDSFTIKGAIYEEDTDVFGKPTYGVADAIALAKSDIASADLTNSNDAAVVGPDHLAQNS